MKVLSLKLKEEILKETDQMVKSIHVSRNAYINEALHVYNQFNRRRLLKKKLIRESKAVAYSSLEVLAEMEQIQDKFIDED